MYYTMIGGANRWTDWVKQYAKEHNTSYSCALSNPDCRKRYRKTHSVTVSPSHSSTRKSSNHSLNHNISNARVPETPPAQIKKKAMLPYRMNKAFLLRKQKTNRMHKKGGRHFSRKIRKTRGGSSVIFPASFNAVPIRSFYGLNSYNNDPNYATVATRILPTNK